MPMEFVSFNFHLTQLRYIKATMDELPTYRPNGKTPAQVQTMIDDAKLVKAAYQTKDTALDLARGNYHQAVKDGHTVAFQVYGLMKTRFRKVPAALGAINNLPVDDDTPQKTQDRMEKTSKLWPLLPNDPNTGLPFLPWTGMDQAAYNGLNRGRTQREFLSGVTGRISAAESCGESADSEVAADEWSHDFEAAGRESEESAGHAEEWVGAVRE